MCSRTRRRKIGYRRNGRLKKGIEEKKQEVECGEKKDSGCLPVSLCSVCLSVYVSVRCLSVCLSVCYFKLLQFVVITRFCQFEPSINEGYVHISACTRAHT